MDAAHFEKKLTSEVLFEGRVVTLTKDTALLENGKTATREVVPTTAGPASCPILRTAPSAWSASSATPCSRSCGSCPPNKLEQGEDPPSKPPSGSWRRSAA